MEKKETRFAVVLREGNQLSEEGVRQILVDKQTGVNYLVWKAGYAGGITPMYDADGELIVTKD